MSWLDTLMSSDAAADSVVIWGLPAVIGIVLVVVAFLLAYSAQSVGKAYNALAFNKVEPILINNTVTGDNICLLLEEKDLHKAVNVIHGQIFGISTNINVALFGVGLVGGTLIDQILKNKK